MLGTGPSAAASGRENLLSGGAETSSTVGSVAGARGLQTLQETQRTAADTEQLGMTILVRASLAHQMHRAGTSTQAHRPAGTSTQAHRPHLPCALRPSLC